MNRVSVLSCFLIVLVMGDMVASFKWPAYPKDIKSSNCQTKLGCDKKFKLHPTRATCKAFCLGRKRFWEKCGANGKKDPKSKICNAVLANAAEKAGKGVIKFSDAAVNLIVKLAATAAIGALGKK